MKCARSGRSHSIFANSDWLCAPRDLARMLRSTLQKIEVAIMPGAERRLETLHRLPRRQERDDW